MNTATANLENDHVYILRLIDVMEEITTLPEVNVDHIETIIDIIRNFADGVHHAKEEKLLFPKMVEKGFSFDQGPVAVMMSDHVSGRKYVKGISDNLILYKSGDAAVLNDLYKNMRGYIDLLRSHISKENNVLFRMADKAFSNEEQQFLSNEFKKVETNADNEDVNKKYITRINELAKVYAV
jgi:hemerythrin-like domain-containing protein